MIAQPFLPTAYLTNIPVCQMSCGSVVTRLCDRWAWQYCNCRFVFVLIYFYYWRCVRGTISFILINILTFSHRFYISIRNSKRCLRARSLFTWKICVLNHNEIIIITMSGDAFNFIIQYLHYHPPELICNSNRFRNILFVSFGNAINPISYVISLSAYNNSTFRPHSTNNRITSAISFPFFILL